MKSIYSILLFIMGCFIIAAIFFGTIEGVKQSFKATPKQGTFNTSDYAREQKQKMDDLKSKQKEFSDNTSSQIMQKQRALMDENRRKQEAAKRALEQKMMDYRRNR